MKILVTGTNGQLGYDMMRELSRRCIDAKGVSRQDFDLTDEAAMRSCITDYRPNAVVHCAAYTAVDRAEEEPELAMKVNGEATRHIAEICRDIHAKMIYISTDYVFPGDGETLQIPDAPRNPVNAYGKSKLAGELAVQEILPEAFIVRISWVFGIHGKNFIRTMLQLAENHDELRVVNDQFGSPTYTVDLARLLADMVQTRKYGVYHATNEGVCSWAELAAEVFRQYGCRTKVIPVPSSAYPTKAVRPKNSRLSKACLDEAGFDHLPHWKDAVGRYLIELSGVPHRQQ